MFLSNLNGFSPSPPAQGFNQRKDYSRVWKEKGSKWFYHFSLYLLVFGCISCVFCSIFWASLVLCFVLFNMFLFGCFLVLFIYLFIFKLKKKYKNSVCFVYIGTYVPWMAIETSFSKFYIICSLDEHLCAQLSKWALWLLFVMSKVRLSLVLNTPITLFDWND